MAHKFYEPLFFKEQALFHVKYIQSEMKQIETHIEIKAPAEKVWDILTDYDGHSSWIVENQNSLPISE